MRIHLAIVASAALLVGCGGGSSNDDTTTPVETATGYYVDSAVSGVSYTCGSQSGLTQDNGAFTFDVGQGCTFSLGGMMLRTVASGDLSDGVEIQERTLDVARLLQSLDNDGNPENGIEISSEVVAALAANNITTVPTSDTEMAQVIATIQSQVTTYAGEAKSTEQTMLHLEQLIVDVSSDKTAIAQGDTVTLTSTIQQAVQSNLTYTWKEGSQTLGTEAELTLSDLDVGAHTMTLTVTDEDGVSKSDSVTVTVTAYTPMTVTMSASSASILDTDDLTLYTNVQNGNGTLTYNWTDTKNIWTPLIVPAPYGISQHIAWTEVNSSLAETNQSTLTLNLPEGRHVLSLNVADQTGHNADAVSSYNASSSTLSIWVNFQSGSAVTNPDLKLSTDQDDLDYYIIDRKKGLMWVNDEDRCKAVHPTVAGQDFDTPEVRNYCENLEFAGHNDWRIATTAEVSDFIIRTYNGNILPSYYAKCNLMVGDNGDGTFSQIVSGFGAQNINSETNLPAPYGAVGDVYDDDISDTISNFGMRCVRNN